MYGRRYNISMKTPLGSRGGTIEVKIEENRLTGQMHILKHSEPFEGTVDEEGNCTISGRIVTLVSTMPYTATGILAADYLKLAMVSGRNNFSLTGTASEEEKNDGRSF